MARIKSEENKERITITVDIKVKEKLEAFCDQHHTHVSTFINSLLKRNFNTEEEMLRERCKELNRQFQEAKFLLDNFYKQQEVELK